MFCVLGGSHPYRVKVFRVTYLERRKLIYSSLWIGKSSFGMQNLEASRDLRWERAFNREYRDFIVKELTYLQERPVKEQETMVEWFTAMRKCKLSGK